MFINDGNQSANASQVIYPNPNNGNGAYGYWDDSGKYHAYPYPYWTSSTLPNYCTETNHYFPCKHCNKCQCGKLTLPEK